MNVRFGHPLAVVLLEDVHLLHVGLRVLLHDDVDRRRELHVAADVIAVRVRVDDRRHRLRRQLLDLVEDRLAPARILRVDDDDAVGADEDGGVAAAASSSMKRLSFSFSTSTTFGPCGCGCALHGDATARRTASNDAERALMRLS